MVFAGREREREREREKVGDVAAAELPATAHLGPMQAKVLA
jgi:hypothetical protein